MTGRGRETQVVERLGDCGGWLLLAACVAGPWVLLGFCGPWWSLAGAVAAPLVYTAFLAPRSGICLGLPALPIMLNSLVALIAACVILLIRAA